MALNTGPPVLVEGMVWDLALANDRKSRHQVTWFCDLGGVTSDDEISGQPERKPPGAALGQGSCRRVALLILRAARWSIPG